MRNIAIIPARSGSKRLSNKNIKLLAGKPLMAYSILEAIQSGMFDEVMVSTDSENYAKIAQEYGASVPFLRSLDTASDSASSWDMIDEVLREYQKRGKSFDSFCLLQPTSPLRKAEDIQAAYELFVERKALAVVSVCETEHSPLWCGHLPENRELTSFLNSEKLKNSQNCGKYYRLNGAIYIVDIKRFDKDKSIYQKGSFAYVMSQERSVDIDTELDFRLASVLLGE